MSELYLLTARREAAAKLKAIVSWLADTECRFGDKACVYATGSYGRMEAGPRSDLDLFIVVKEGADGKRALDGIEEIKLKCDLIGMAEAMHLPKFDAGGKFLESHSAFSFIEMIGSTEDDYRNTLTGRMLMLLESRPLIGSSFYAEVVQSVISGYYRDYEGHEESFVPAFLLNDILRMWRTFCVNYEFFRRTDDSRQKLKNLKLKFSRMLTCYSAVVYLQALFAKYDTVSPEHILHMVGLTPTERLDELGSRDFWGDWDELARVTELVAAATSDYSQFLELTHRPTRAAVKALQKGEPQWREMSYGFGGHLGRLIEVIGGYSASGDKFRRLITV